jgi:RNA polymerase sigma-70 factor (ECF subfamily)
MVMLMPTTEKSLVMPAILENYDFSDLYNEYFTRVYNYVNYRVSDFHAAEDLTSQIFIKVFIKQQYYQSDKAPISAWIFTIARNTVTDYYRQRQRTAHVSVEEKAELADFGRNLDDTMALKEICSHLRQALTELSQREREIIALKFWSGFSNREIASFTGYSESNTGVILFRAMQRLRRVLESRGMNLNDGEK